MVNLCTLLFMRNNVSTRRSQLLLYSTLTDFKHIIFYILLYALQSRVLTLIILIIVLYCLVSYLFFFYRRANCKIFSTVYRATLFVKHIVYYFIYLSTYIIIIITFYYIIYNFIWRAYKFWILYKQFIDWNNVIV